MNKGDLIFRENPNTTKCKNCYLYCREGGDDRWTAESVRYERKVCERALYDWVENVLRPGVAKRRTVLVEQVHQLFGHLSAKK